MKIKYLRLTAVTRSGQRQLTHCLAIAIAVITFLLYLPALKCDLLLWDDTLYVVNNPHIRSLDLRFFTWAFTDLSAGFWHPLTWISYAIDYAVWKLNPVGYHLTAITLHAINSSLVVIVVTRLLNIEQKTESSTKAPAVQDVRGILLIGGITGILFGIHPLHVESVAWASERKDLLCALFFLWSLIVYVEYVAALRNAVSPGADIVPKYNRRYFLVLFLFLLALASKTMAVSLPVVFLILDCYSFKRIQKGKDLVVVMTEKIPFILLSLCISLISLFAQNNLGALSAGKGFTLYERALTALRALFMYLWKMVVPVKLIPLYPFPDRITILSLEYLLGLATFLGVSAACILLLKKNKVLLVVWAYYLVTLLPASGIVPIGAFSMADRFTYLPSIGPFFVAGLVLEWVKQRCDHAGVYANLVRRVAVSLTVMYLVLLSVLLNRQIHVWDNSVTLWSQVLEKGPYELPFAYSIRGLAYLELGMYEEAINDCNRAIMIQPDYAQAFFNRSRVYMATGRLDQSMQDLDRSIGSNKQYADAYAMRGQVHKAMGNLTAAIDDYTTAVTIDPQQYEVYNYRGVVFKELGLYTRAIEDYNRTLALLRDSEEAYNNRAVAYRHLGRLDLAIEDYSKAIAINPKFPLAYCNRGIAYKDLKKYDNAIADFSKAKSLEPDLIKAYMELAECFLATGRPDLAREEYQLACGRKSAEGCNALQAIEQRPAYQ